MRGRNNQLAGQIGEHLVCAELGRRGIIATPFAGNVPTFDVVAANEECRTVALQVKASRSLTWPTLATEWMDIEFEADEGRQRYIGPRQIDHADLIYICVYIAPPSGQDRYFVLTKSDLQRICIDHHVGWMERHNWRRPRRPDSFDCRYGLDDGLLLFENNWKLIEDRLLQLSAVPREHPAGSTTTGAKEQ